MICWKCKSEMPDGLKYCGKCGVHMNRTVNFFQWLISKKGLLVLISLLLVAAVTLCFCFLPDLDFELPFFGTTKQDYSDIEAAIKEKINSERIPGDELPLMYLYSNAILDEISFQVERDDRSKGVSTVTFTYIDVLALADSVGTDITDPSAFYQACLDLISSGDAPTVVKTISITYTILVTDKGTLFVIEDSLPLADVLTGGAASAYLGLLEEDQ